MYKLNLPKYKIEDYFEELLVGRHNNTKNNFLTNRLISAKGIFIEAENSYFNLASTNSLHQVNPVDIVNLPEMDKGIVHNISTSEMSKVYEVYFVDRPSSRKIGRKVYESILANSDHNLCPYCSQREVKTVDHFLPKSKYMLFSITPINLLPCCSDCNKDKLDKQSLDENEMLIHPYFDDLNEIDWLNCRVVEDMLPVNFTYEVSNSITDYTLRSRINYQFNLLELGKLYADNAAREFTRRLTSLIREYNSNPTNRAKDFLNDNYLTNKDVNLNSWQTKLFLALKQSEWFAEFALPKLEEFYRNK
ncbi:HNH endonuclease [Bacillus pumilus]|uniref:HNH endonuclease n=1 Tax=Bacillus pumilus TaxID=1408 RepID=UPI003392ED48